MRRWVYGVLATVVSVAAFGAEHRAEIEAWRSERVERLQRPDGWLALVGLHWLEAGRYVIGSAPSASADEKVLTIAHLPALFGTIEVGAAGVRLQLADGVSASANGEPIAAALELQAAPGSNGPRVLAGEVQFTLIARGERRALRVWDSAAPTRTGFAGIDYFEIDPRFRFEARFEPHPAGRTIDIATVLGTLEPMKNPGRVHFDYQGQAYSLEAVDEGDGRLFLIFADRTNRSESYGPGRFVYADAAVDGRTVLDFNRAYNPPCAFTEFSTCPLPPPENRLDFEVRAGEKRYAAAKS
jgi:hypothetical protein